eukprot:c24838_g1_i1 orf=498-1850(-)
MTTNFRRWEEDPLFAAAEEVQDSADRLESTYRMWIYTKELLASSPDDPEVISSLDFRMRELSTALGTAMWQLEEFERAAAEAALTDQAYVREGAPARHKQFIEAIRCEVASIKKNVLCFSDKKDTKILPVVNLQHEDKDDLEVFLSGTRLLERNVGRDALETVSERISKEAGLNTSCTSRESSGWISAKHTLSRSEFKKSDNQYPPKGLDCEMKTLNSQCSNGQEPSVKLDNVFLDLQFEGGDHPVAQPSPKVKDVESKFNNDDEKCRGITFERVNGHRRSTSVGGTFNSLKDGGVVNCANDIVGEPLRAENLPNGFNFWAFLSKKKLLTDKLKVSKSVFKRWKDGEAVSKDCRGVSRYFKLNRATMDVESGMRGSCFGGDVRLLNGCALGSMVDGEEKQLNGCGGSLQQGLQLLPQYSLPSNRPVQITSAILLALGVLGLLFFYATGAH